MISQALEYLRSHPNRPFTLSEIIHAIRMSESLGSTELLYLQAELFYHFQKLTTQQPYQWQSTSETTPKYYFVQQKIVNSEELISTVEKIQSSNNDKGTSGHFQISKGFPVSALDMSDKNTKAILHNELKEKRLSFITPGCPPPFRAPSRLVQTHSSLEVRSFTSTIGVSPEKGVLEIGLTKASQSALCTIKVRSSNPKVVITPLMEDVKPGGVGRFMFEGKDVCESVLRVSLDASDRLVLPLKVTTKTLKPESLLFSTRRLCRAKHDDQATDVDLLYQWHVLSTGFEDEQLRVKKHCSMTYAGPKDDSKSIVPEEAISAFSAFQRPPTNIHMRCFLPKLLRICKPEEHSK